MSTRVAAPAAPSLQPVLTPGLPRGLPWPAVVQSLATVFFMESLVRHDLGRFDGLMTFRLLGLGEMVIVWDPDLIKQLFTGDRDVFRAGEANARVLSPAGPSSVLLLDGERHLRMRRLMLPPFHGEAVRAYGGLIGELAAAEVNRWPAGEEFPIHPRMQAIVIEVILRAVIGVRDPTRLARLRPLLARVGQASVMAFWAEGAYPRLVEGRLGARLPWIRARREADALIYEEIAAHRAMPDGGNDILSMLMAARDEDGHALGDAELRDQIVTLLVAGQETTATALAWCFERLLRHPHALTTLRRRLEADDGDTYLDAVINETLRVRPVIDAAWRRLAAPVELAGYRLPAGTIVAASIIGAQRSQAFGDPEEFRPERFLDAPAPPYTLIPFGGGSRRCIGASFAILEMKTIIRTVLERVELRAATQKSERPTRWRRITVVPSRGGRVVVTSPNATVQ